MDDRATLHLWMTEPVWRARRAAHEQRVEPWIAPVLARRRTGTPHPVEDFLFTYYTQRPGALRRWHPGFGTGLEGGAEYADQPGYVVEDGVARLHHDAVADRLPLLLSLRQLLASTAARPPQLGCFGLHEWAMVYRADSSAVRHQDWPLRLGATGTDEVVEGHRIACTHFDAVRFFTPQALPRNTRSPGPRDRADFEQPGCLHTGMDLYKHAFRLSPLVASELVADCFELARDIRVLDMRASPYDLTALGHAPVRIETASGKQEYVAAQRAFAERGAPLRARLLAECDRLLG